MRNARVLASLASLVLLAASCASAPVDQPEAGRFTAGERLTVRSSLLDEQRELLVLLPDSYRTTDFRYPVLYLLDAEGDFLHVAGIVEFLAGIDRIPETIVVGVVNTNRSRDLTPPSDDEQETAFWDATGGAERFRRVLREELIPFVDARYRTEPFRVLRGSSFGGLFALHDLVSTEPIFDAAIVTSPAVGWNRGALLEAAPAFFERGAPRPLYVGSAGRDFPGNLAEIERFVELVEAGEPGEHWRHERFDDEGHYSLHHLASYRGLEFVFRDWPVPDEVAERAEFEAYERHFAELSRRYGYTIRVPLRSIVRIGNQLLRERRFDDGIAVFERAVELYPELPEARWRVGEAYRLAGAIDEARTHFERAYRMAVERDLPDVDDYRESLEALDSRPSRP